MQKDSGKQVGVKVFCRFRPCDITKTLTESKKHTLEIMNGKSIRLESEENPQNHLFHLDMVFKPTITQEEMFSFVGEPIVRDVLFGYNGTVFAYGQTGSGKTHSLFGDMTSQQSAQRGIIPRSCEMLFQHIEEANDIEEAVVKCSFIEIYKEKLQDLLEPKCKLKIRENPDKTIYVQGVHEEYVSCFGDVYNLLQIGFRNRMVASTLMNQQSSRSHCVLILAIKQTMRGGTVKISKVNFADLAGSEKVRKTGASGGLLKEAQAINLSLSALGNVISALTSKSAKHVPYRNSKLTFLLQDALGGNTKTSLITTASSDKYNYDETISTLRFATRAKQMKNKVTVNKQLSVKELQIVIEVYKQKVSVANATIMRLQKLILLMRSPQYNAATYGPQIDMYLIELQKIQQADVQLSGATQTQQQQQQQQPQASARRKSKKKSHAPAPVPAPVQEQEQGQQQPQNDANDQRKIISPKHRLENAQDNSSQNPKKSEQQLKQQQQQQQKRETHAPQTEAVYDGDTGSVDSSSSIESEPAGPDQDAIKVINDLHADIESKDNKIQKLHEEMSLMKAKLYAQRQEVENQQAKQRQLKSELKEAKKLSKKGTRPSSTNQMQATDSKVDKLEHAKLQKTLEEQSHQMDELKMEKDEIERDRAQLLLWNQELQKRLDNINDNLDSEHRETMRITDQQIKNVLKPLDKSKMSEQFELQLEALRTIMQSSRSASMSFNNGNFAIVNDLKQNLEEKSSDDDNDGQSGEIIIAELHKTKRITNMGEHRTRAEQTSRIINKLQEQLTKLPQMSKEDGAELTSAALTSICCVLDNSLSTEAQLPDVSEIDEMRKQKKMSDDELNEIDALKKENQQLIRKLAEMKTTWIAHLDMLIGPNSLESNDNINLSANNDVALVAPPRKSSKFGLKKKSKSKFVRPAKMKRQLSDKYGDDNATGTSRYGLKNLIGYLSGALLQYFGQVAILRGSLFICNRRVSLLNFKVNEEDWKKVYVILTKAELLAYRSVLHAETDTKSPLFKCNMESIVSVLKIEEVLSAMAMQSPTNELTSSTNDVKVNDQYLGMFILTSTEEKYVFKAEASVSRDVWIENIEQILSQID